jgi:hypothetical protein
VFVDLGKSHTLHLGPCQTGEIADVVTGMVEGSEGENLGVVGVVSGFGF